MANIEFEQKDDEKISSGKQFSTLVENSDIGDNNLELDSFHDTDEKLGEVVDGDGLSYEELRDPNKIKVTIADYKTPLVILFGPPACGKTMTLIRLTRYLQQRGYTVQPTTSFRPAYDKNYRDMCENFDMMINSEDAAQSTNKINFMLVQVMYGGKPLCQILEGPGEYYFKPETPNAPFPKYVNAIINSQNRKIWAIMTEPDHTNLRMGVVDRKNYVSKIQRLKSKISPRDKVIFVFNKIDETQFVISPGNIKNGLAMQHVDYLYPNIFTPFKNVNPISKLWKPNNFDFVAFQTGDFSETADGTLTFEQGPDIYPQKMWEIIQKRIRG